MIILDVPVLCNVILSAIMFILDKKTSFGTIKDKWKQIIIGILFGALAIFSSEYGVDVNGAIMNVRDASPLCAGLIFGAPAGILSGLIGGIYRYMAVYWGSGSYTRLACSIATILSGFIAAFLRRFMFDDKKPAWIYGVGTGIICEVLHMLMIFFTNMSDPEKAFIFVRKCTISMIIANSTAVALSMIIVSLLGKEKIKVKKERKKISQTFQLMLLVCIVLAYSATSIFTYSLQTRMTSSETEKLLNTNIQDISQDIRQTSDKKSPDIEEYTKNRHIDNNGFILICRENKDIISNEQKYRGKKLSDIGINLENKKEKTIFETRFESKSFFCTYTFAEGYYIVGVIPKNDALYMRNVLLYVSTFLEILIFAVLFCQIYFMIKKMIIDNLRMINTNLSEIINGNLDVTVNVQSNQEFASLSEDINQTVGTLKRYIADAEERMDEELELAKQIQYSALPAVFPPFPNRHDFDIYAKMITAKEVGGDFYDFYMLGESKLVFLIADVSGKGIPAAMFMMRAKTTIKDLVETGLSPDRVFTIANQRLCENNAAGMFVTAWLGILDLKTGGLQFVNAGHNPPLIRCSNGKYEYLRAKGGMVLGGIDCIKYKTNETRLMPGDMILLYTDGITEATDGDGQLYGEDRLISLVNENILKKPEQMILTVADEVDGFAGDAPQFDDMTMLSVAVNYIKGEEEIIVIPDDQSFEAVQLFGETLTRKLSVIPKVANKVNIVIDEIYSNIVHYSDAKLAKIEYRIEKGRLVLTFTDNGKPYNPLETKEPDLTISAEDREIGGLGIFIVKRMSESMKYEYENGKNILQLAIVLV